MHLNNYHPIPSIPSRKNVFGYTENESKFIFEFRIALLHFG